MIAARVRRCCNHLPEFLLRTKLPGKLALPSASVRPMFAPLQLAFFLVNDRFEKALPQPSDRRLRSLVTPPLYAWSFLIPIAETQENPIVLLNDAEAAVLHAPQWSCLVRL